MKGAEPTGDCEDGGSRRSRPFCFPFLRSSLTNVHNLEQMNPEEATAYFKYMTEVRVPKMSVDELLGTLIFR